MSWFVDTLWLLVELSLLLTVVTFSMHYIQKWVRLQSVFRYVESKSTFSAFSAVIAFAFVTPFCSCSTVPIIIQMNEQHVRFRYVMTFLFASPLLDPTILTVMTVLFGWDLALLYTVIASLLSIIIGTALEWFGFERDVRRLLPRRSAERPMDLRRAYRETKQLVLSVLPYLLVGAVLGSTLRHYVPAAFFETYIGGEEWWMIPVAALIGIPLYIRLSFMLPMAHLFVLKGMGLGPVMALLISSAGASLPELALLKSLFRTRLVAVFIGSVLFMATLSGTLFFFIG